jgi:MoaA/NifB/PqqE/SkfB family radical SAM enzyme
MRGIKVFDKIIESIHLANKRDIKVIISTVVMKDNIHLMDEICQLAENLGCSIEIYPCEDIIRDFPNKSYHIKDIQEIIPNISTWANQIRTLRKKYRNILTDPFSVNVVQSGFGGYPNYNQKILRCHVAEAYLFINHDGYISYPCKIHPILKLNALKYPISTIYYSNKVKQIMKMHDNYSFCNKCRLGCAIASSIPTRWKTVYAKYIKGFIDGGLR